jgi:hypothetical protein
MDRVADAEAIPHGGDVGPMIERVGGGSRARRMRADERRRTAVRHFHCSMIAFRTIRKS